MKQIFLVIVAAIWISACSHGSKVTNDPSVARVPAQNDVGNAELDKQTSLRVLHYFYRVKVKADIYKAHQLDDFEKFQEQVNKGATLADFTESFGAGNGNAKTFTGRTIAEVYGEQMLTFLWQIGFNGVNSDKPLSSEEFTRKFWPRLRNGSTPLKVIADDLKAINK